MVGPISGQLLQEKANKLAMELGVEDFCTLTGFINRWKTRHGISSKRVCGEEREVSPADTESWRSSVLPPLLEQFKPEDIYNLDETGLFFSSEA